MHDATKPGLLLDTATTATTRSPYSVFREFRMGGEKDTNCPAVTYVRLEPGDVAPRHAHGGWTVNVVVAGSCHIGDFPDMEMKPGSVLTSAPNVQYGPVIPGPQGVTLYEIFDSLEGRPPIWDDPDEPFSAGYAKWLEEQGLVKTG